MVRRGWAGYLFGIAFFSLTSLVGGNVFGISFAETQIIQPTNPAPVEDLGYSLAASGNFLVAGAINDNGGVGAATVFQRDQGGLWSPVTKLLPSDPNEIGMGETVGFDGNSVIASGVLYNVSPSKPGGVYIFEHGSGTQWTQTAQFAPPAKLDQFGNQLGIDGSTAVVSGVTLLGPGQSLGYLEVYKKSIGGIWAQTQEIALGASRSFVSSLDLQDGTLAVGTFRNDIGGPKYSVDFYQDSPSGFVPTSTITAPPGATAFGNSLSFDHNQILIGAPSKAQHGAAYVYEREPNDVWLQTARLVPNDLSTRFGVSAGILDGDLAFVSSRGDSQSSAGGRVDVFQRDLFGQWNKIQSLKSFVGADDFGFAMSETEGQVFFSSGINTPGMIHVYSQVPEPAFTYYAFGMLGCIAGKRRRLRSRHAQHHISPVPSPLRGGLGRG